MAKSVLSTFFSHGSFKIKVHASSSQNNTQLLLKKDVCMHALLENYKLQGFVCPRFSKIGLKRILEKDQCLHCKLKKVSPKAKTKLNSFDSQSQRFNRGRVVKMYESATVSDDADRTAFRRAEKNYKLYYEQDSKFSRK